MTAILQHCRSHADYDDNCHDCYDLQYGVWKGCDCWTSGSDRKPKQHGADPHAKNCAVYLRLRKQGDRD
jgi:hypothetical protein